jgi:transcriptional regulator NrdR family protein
VGEARSQGGPPRRGIRCPRCGPGQLGVIRTLPLPGGRVRRYRRCGRCGEVVITLESPAKGETP